MLSKIVSLSFVCIIIICTFTGCKGQETVTSEWFEETVTTVVNSNASDKDDVPTDSSTTNKPVSSSKKSESSDKIKSENSPSAEDEKSIYTYCTDKILEKSVLYKGDTTRLASKIKSALADKNHKTKIACLGDSITAGASVGMTEGHYANKFLSYWKKYISNSVELKIKGSGATTSYFGAHWADEAILADKPDIIFIEYVNDMPGEQHTVNCMDSLIRKCLSLDNKPAVILLEMSYNGTRNAQASHSKPAKAYGVPMISWQNGLSLSLIQGDIKWPDVAGDEVHPNKRGHHMLGEMMWYFVDSVIPGASNAKEPSAFNTPAVTDDVYKNCKILNRTNLTPASVGNFTEVISDSGLSNGWGTTKGGEISFKVTAKRIGIAILRSNTIPNGKAEIYVDGPLVVTLNGKHSFTYIEARELKVFKTLEEHTVTVKVLDGENNDFQVLGLFVS